MEEQVSEESKSTFHEIRKDKILLAIFIAIILLGITVRFIYPTEPGLWNDDMSTLPTGLLWFYPHESYPGLSGQGEPALGNFFFGAGCMLSGEDFSNVTKIRPMWYPDRSMLLGKQLTAAEDYCRIPSYLFGFLFFLGAILFSLALLDKYSALFFTAFFAFYQHILQFSRWIHVDIIAYTFIIFGLLCLWKAYSSIKYSKAEIYYFIASMVLFSFAFATKLPTAVYALLAFVILFLKYKDEIYCFLKMAGKWLGLKAGENMGGSNMNLNLHRLLIVSISGIMAYTLALLPSFEFSFKNIFLVIAKYKATDAMQGASIGSLALNKNIGAAVHNLLLSLNIYDIILLLLSIFVLVHIILRKKEKKEKFILALVALFACMLLIFPAMDLLRICIAFVFGIIICMSLIFSESGHSPFYSFKAAQKTTRILFIILLTAYISYSAFNAFSEAPYNEYRNSLVCKDDECQIPYHSFAETQTGVFLQNLLNDTNYTFDLNGIASQAYYYARPEEAEPMLFWRESFRQQIGRMPTAQERASIFKPLNRTVQYLLVAVNMEYGDEFIDQLKQEYNPNYKIMLKHNIEAVWIYDLKNLTKL